MDRARGGQKPSLRILRNLYQALGDPAGVLAHRLGALERVKLLLADWTHTQHKLVDTEQRMVAVLDQLELTELVTSIGWHSSITDLLLQCGSVVDLPGRVDL
jgi:hypothetical protein